ncbi:hypothetical protein B0H13DRAFT_1886412 [Mycena leptocephala]|nr:hypothetical protein B0H13DRAFT_1886412 [Mycena leptocephala]
MWSRCFRIAKRHPTPLPFIRRTRNTVSLLGILPFSASHTAFPDLLWILLINHSLSKWLLGCAISPEIDAGIVRRQNGVDRRNEIAWATMFFILGTFAMAERSLLIWLLWPLALYAQSIQQRIGVPAGVPVDPKRAPELPVESIPESLTESLASLAPPPTESPTEGRPRRSFWDIHAIQRSRQSERKIGRDSQVEEGLNEANSGDVTGYSLKLKVRE